jgi:alpha-L-rhamnosidase
VQIVADAAAVLGRDELAREYGDLARAIRAAFRDEYVAPSGLISSDSATAYALAIMFDLYDDPTARARAGTRTAELAAERAYRISTGFVGTSLVLPALSAMGDTKTAYRLLTETACPSWLYTVAMGATTIWERWDSMLPDGSINPGEMTSFNHYALGSVGDWIHRVIGGVAPAAPGYREVRFAPVPGRGVEHASSSLRTPYGIASCSWRVDGNDVTIEVGVPPNTSATVLRPGLDDEPLDVLAGTHRWDYAVSESVAAEWADSPDTRQP